MSQKLKTTPKPSPKNTLFNYFSKSSGNTPQNVEKTETENSTSKMEVDEDQENQKNNKNLMGKKLDFGERYMKTFFLNNIILTQYLFACRRQTSIIAGIQRR